MEKRLVLALILCVGVFVLYVKFFAPTPPPKKEGDDAAPGTTEEPAKGTEAESGAGGVRKAPPVVAPVVEGIPEYPVDDHVELETEKFLLAFTTRGASLREAWLKEYEIRPGVDLDGRDHWYRILREDLSQHREGEGISAREVRKAVLTGAVRLLDEAGETDLVAGLDTAPWRLVRRDEERGEVVFAMGPLDNGLTLTKTYTIHRGEERYDLRVRLEMTRADDATIAAGTPLTVSFRGPVGLVPDVGDGSRVIDVPVTGYYGHHYLDLEEVRAGGGLEIDEGDEAWEAEAWVGLGNLFFASAFIPSDETPAEGVSLWGTWDSEAVATLEAELTERLRARGELGSDEERRLTTEELDAFMLATVKSCMPCSQPAKPELVKGIEAILGRRLSEKELGRLSRLSMATAVRRSVGVPEAGETADVFSGMLFLGPKEKPILDLERYQKLEDTRSTGWKWISEPLLWILRQLFAIFGNYGVAIIFLTLIVRGCMFPLSRHQQMSMQKYSRDMQKVKPKLDELRKKFKDNPRKMNQEMMKLYKAEGVSMVPKGCLVMFLQIPIFIGLFNGLRAAIELRHAPFLWVKDLTGPDHLLHMPFMKNVPLMPEWLNLFPITMTVLWWLSAKMTPKPVDPQQQSTAKMMQYMPLIFGVMLYNYQAGLAIYMTISSLWSIVETRLVRRKLAKMDEAETQGLRPVIRK